MNIEHNTAEQEKEVQARGSRVVRVASRSLMEALNEQLGNPKAAIPCAVYDCWLYLSNGGRLMKRLAYHYPPTLEKLVEDYNADAESWGALPTG